MSHLQSKLNLYVQANLWWPCKGYRKQQCCISLEKKHRKFIFLYIPKRHFLNFVALTIWLIIAVCKNYSAWENNM